ncbi:GntR family transcriptional regulator [Streptomyces sp. NPDC020681]|uniref:GntR family transcriptional regulator n=1 Tax=Streptomyces sp. NPDC020681 TaxID=3365083 RepID=UPI0037A86679
MAMTQDGGQHGGGARQYQYLRVAEALRERITAKEYRVGDLIPTQQSLMAHYDVSRVTAQRAVETLRSWGLIDEGGRGRGSRVIAMGAAAPQTLAEHIAEAFTAEHVSLDVWSLTTEKLSKIVASQVEDIKSGAVPPPKSISARVLLPSLDVRFPLPRLISDPDDPRPLLRLRRLIRMYAGQLQHSLLAAAEDGRVATVRTELRCVATLPLQKCYILNGTVALTSLYRVREKEVLEEAGSEPLEILDLENGPELFTWAPMAAGRSERDAAHFEELRLLFESCWSKVAEPVVLERVTSSEAPTTTPAGAVTSSVSS